MQILPYITDDYEVIVINDGSADDTGSILNEPSSYYPWVVLGLAYQSAVKYLFGLSVRDVDCDFRLRRRAICDRLRLDDRHPRG